MICRIHKPVLDLGLKKNTEKRNNGENTEMKNSNLTISKEPANLLNRLSAAKLCFS